VRGLAVLRPLAVLGTIGSHAFRVGRSLPDSRLLDRLMRGRAWIVLVGVLLFGLVAINVSLLKLNSVAGRNAETVRTLRIQNTELQAKVSKLASADRLERAGRALGLSMSIAGRVRYLSVRSSDGRRAARAIRTWETLPSFAFAPLPVAPTPVVAQTTTPAPTGAAGATGPTGVAAVPATGDPTGTPTTGVASPQTTTPTTGTATTPAPTGTGQPAGTVGTTQPATGGGQALTTPTG
jgi:hypothetical protein